MDLLHCYDGLFGQNSPLNHLLNHLCSVRTPSSILSGDRIHLIDLQDLKKNLTEWEYLQFKPETRHYLRLGGKVRKAMSGVFMTERLARVYDEENQEERWSE